MLFRANSALLLLSCSVSRLISWEEYEKETAEEDEIDEDDI